MAQPTQIGGVFFLAELSWFILFFESDLQDYLLDLVEEETLNDGEIEKWWRDFQSIFWLFYSQWL